MESPIKQAVQNVGGQSALARAVGVTPQAVQQWVEADRVSHKKAIAVEHVSGVSRHQLRPDVYPIEKAKV